MEKQFEFQLSNKSYENLQTYSKILNKDINTIIDEALNQYFEKNEQKLQSAKTLEADSSMTNLDYEEFWEDVDI